MNIDDFDAATNTTDAIWFASDGQRAIPFADEIGALRFLNSREALTAGRDSRYMVVRVPFGTDVQDVYREAVEALYA